MYAHYWVFCRITLRENKSTVLVSNRQLSTRSNLLVLTSQVFVKVRISSVHPSPSKSPPKSYETTKTGKLKNKTTKLANPIT